MVDQVVRTGRPMLITRRGRGVAVALFFMFSWGGKTAFGRFADAAGFNQGDPKDGSSPANEKRPQGRLTPGGPPMERTTAKDDDGIDRLVPR